MKNMEYKAKCCMYDILVELDRICKKNNIKYTLLGGTLIGAIRHKGFIPWDDDIDVGFLRDEYDKFIKCCKRDLNKHFRIVNAENEDGNPNLYHKIKIKNTMYVEDISKNSLSNKEIFLDIFPLDVSPNNYFIAYIHQLKISFYRRLLGFKCKNDFSKNKNIIKRFLNFILSCLSCFYSKNSLINRLKKLMVKYSKSKSNYVINTFTSYGMKDRVNKNLFSEYIVTNFENKKFSIIKDYDAYLKLV